MPEPKRLTTYDLADHFTHPIQGRKEYDVVIKLAERGVAMTPAAYIEAAYNGFDWDEGRCILIPDKELVSWEYLEKFIPDIREQLQAAIDASNAKILAELERNRQCRHSTTSAPTEPPTASSSSSSNTSTETSTSKSTVEKPLILMKTTGNPTEHSQ